MLSRPRHELLFYKRLTTAISNASFSTTRQPPSPEVYDRGRLSSIGSSVVDLNSKSCKGKFAGAKKWRQVLSDFWVPSGGMTTAEEKKDEAHSFLVQAGLIRQAHAGIYHNLPLGLRVEAKLKTLICNAMKNIGACEVSLSSITSEALWKRSGRIAKSIDEGDHELMAIKDRKNSGFILSPTHEEEITSLVAGATKSYKEFPLRLYQMSRKYRDELRPRRGLLRTKEFLMKDLYTFDLTEEAALCTYEDVRGAYRHLFKELTIPFLEVGAASGNMGGNLSHEYHFPSPSGEDTVLVCGNCGFAANQEVVDQDISVSQNCPSCKENSLSAHRAIEVGHTFHLGTRYSEPLNAKVSIPSSKPWKDPFSSPAEQAQFNNQALVPLQMGCHGIGISRLVGAIATMTADKKGLCWPPIVAPFTVAIVCDGIPPVDEAGKSPVIPLYDGLTRLYWEAANGSTTFLDGVIDDRDKPLAWKLKDADLVGYPITIVLGRQWKETGEYEVQCRSRPDLSRNVKPYFFHLALWEILRELSLPDNARDGTVRWKFSYPNTREWAKIEELGAESEFPEAIRLQVKKQKTIDTRSKQAREPALPTSRTGRARFVGKEPKDSVPKPIETDHPFKDGKLTTPRQAERVEKSKQESKSPEATRTTEDVLREKVKLMERLMALRAEETNLKK